MAIKGITINEGYNNLGTFLLDIKPLEGEESTINTDTGSAIDPRISRLILFKLTYIVSRLPIPPNYRCEFTVKGRLLEENLVYNLFANSDGFIELDTQLQPIVKRLPDEKTVIRYFVSGPLDQRSEETYVLVDTAGGLRYTLITDFTIGNSNELRVLTGTGTSYPVSPAINFTANTIAVYLTKYGEIFGFESDTTSWVSYGKIRFSSIQFPQNLTTSEDGFYQTNGSTGTVTNGFLGDVGSVFAEFSGRLTNPELFNVDVELNVYNPLDAVPVFTQSFTNLLPGTLNFIPVNIPGSAPALPDNSTTITEIETISGTTFSAPFRLFLTNNDLTTVEKIRKAGPIAYINGFPATDVGAEELQLLQAHVDFYSLNPDSEKNQVIINANYKSVASIVDAPASKFTSDLVGTEFTLFEASKIHRIATENKRLVNNLLAGVLNDMQLANPSTPGVSNSTYEASVLTTAVKNCGCDDCKSNISPFSYLMDLLNYGAAHIKHIVPPLYTPTAKTDFIGLLNTKFLQPFGTLNVDCKTLKEEFCRVRLVAEVFESLVSIKISLGQISPIKQAALTAQRNKYLQLVYQSLLQQLGTSLQEVRKVYTIIDPDKKREASKKLANKLGITLYNGTTSVYATDYLFLTLNSPPSPAQLLSASNLEIVFGFRDTQRNVLTYPPASLISQWQEAKRMENWTNQDFPLSVYSREGYVPGNFATIKPEWLPIIDPDNMGPQNFTYNSFDAHQLIWKNRKADTDAFIQHFIFGSNFVSVFAADIERRIIKVENKDISSQLFEDNLIELLNPLTSTWVSFGVNSKLLKDTTTIINLEKSTPSNTQPALFQPASFALFTKPVVRYMRELVLTSANIVDITPGSGPPYLYELTWPSDVIADFYTGTGSRIKLMSDDGVNPPIIYDNTGSLNTLAVTVISAQQVQITVNNALSASFLAAPTIRYYYDVVVELVNDTVLDVNKLINDATTSVFDAAYTYNYTSPCQVSGSSFINYFVWKNNVGSITPPYPSIDAAWAALTGTNFEKLKTLQALIAKGSIGVYQKEIITNKEYLALPINNFNIIINLLIKCANYNASMYSLPRPTLDELYDIGSILRVSAKNKLSTPWLKEELVYPEPSSSALVIQAKGSCFWQPLVKALPGSWDGRLQTIPASLPVNPDKDIAIIDPDNIQAGSFLNTPEAEPYKALYVSRKAQLKAEYDTIYDTFTLDIPNGFTKVLNYINKGDTTIPFDIFPYAQLVDLFNDLNDLDPFLRLKAEKVAYSAFRFTPDEFNYIYNLKLNAESGNALLYPSPTEYAKCAKLCLRSYKLIQMYFNISIPWVNEEIVGSINLPSTSAPVKYYNVFNMSLANYRSNENLISEWDTTLKNWNRLPFIQPDFVPPQYIKNFIPSSITYSLWNSRNSQILADQTTLNSLFNPSLIVSTLVTNFQNVVRLLIARAGVFSPPPAPSPDLFVFFTNIKLAEEGGESIKPLVTQLGFTLEAYRFLETTYNTLLSEPPASLSQLVADEYKTLIDIFIRTKYANVTFDWVVQEYTNNLPLTQKDFQLLNLQPTVFPITNLPEYNVWRAPYANRKAWKDKLETRIQEEKNAGVKLKDILQEVEDVNMPVMRDALITALTLLCESFDDAAERLAKTYFIETKDNCCYKHTRVSFAIETLQGFYLALQTGVFDDFVQNFKLLAPDFEQEWKWLGSYASWRGAMFTFIYPENLLYPTLKRQQSPAFVKLATTLREANRFSPKDACDAAKEYEDYLKDLSDLEIIATASVNAQMANDSNETCCDDGNNAFEYVTFFVGQSRTSKRAYYSFDRNIYVTDRTSHSFWYPLNLPEAAKIVNAIPLCNRTGPNWNVQQELSLWLFYTYTDKNSEFKFASIKKDLQVPSSAWSEQEDIKIPINEDGLLINPVVIRACQSSSDWMEPSFLVGYQAANAPNYVVCTYDKNKNNLYFATQGDDSNLITVTSDVITAIKVYLRQPGTTNIQVYHAFLFVYKDRIAAISASGPSYSVLYINQLQIINGNPAALFSFSKINFAFQNRQEEDSIIVGYSNTSNQLFATKITCYADIDGTFLNPVRTSLQVNKTFSGLVNIATSNTQSLYLNTFGFERITGSSKINSAAAVYYRSTDNTLNFTPFYDLTPNLTVLTGVDSAECVPSLKSRASEIKANFLSNNPTVSSSATNYVFEVINEAYYFVSMLLALDQQKRGAFEAALNWYRSVYDYQQDDNANRKIFYGLIAEESIVNSYAQTPDWLLDPLNPHLIAGTRTNAYTKYTIMSIVQCLYAYADREFTLDTVESVPRARRLYSMALELLKTKALNLKANECEVKAKNCIQPWSIELEPGSPYNETARMLQNNLQKIGVPATIETIGSAIEILLNEATAETIGTAIAESEYLIRQNMPAPATVLDVSGITALQNEKCNSAYSYVLALQKENAFNETVAEAYTARVANMAGLLPEQLNLTEFQPKLNWLSTEVPSNNLPFKFEFASTAGVQNLSGELAFNPARKTGNTIAYEANLQYSNAPVLIHTNTYNLPSGYTALSSYLYNSFCMPKNPVYKGLGLKGNVELYKIFNCRNIAGMVRELDVFAAATDSTTAVPIIGAGGNLTLPGVGNFAPSQYRFKVLVERAKVIAAQAQQLESLFLAALEKEDAETYSQLRAKQDLTTAKATVKLQDLRIKQAENEKGLANIQLDKATFSQSYFDDLLAEGINDYEIEALDLLENQIEIYTSATQFAIAASVINFGFSIANLQGVGDLGTNAMSFWAQELGTKANLNNILASYKRREQEWNYQKNLAGFDISLANQQIKIAEDGVRIAGQEREISELNATHAADSLEFLKNKFTNAELYNWMGNVLERSYSYMLNLSTAIARTAERQLYFERQEQAGPFILDDYWEMPTSGYTAGASGSEQNRRGLTGSARLLVDITRLDQYAFESNKRKLQMTKVISLAQNFPSEFQQFKETGVLNFDLTNQQFDYDFPGHYLRLINSVKTTVVGLLPVYDQIKATLTSGSVSYTVLGGTTFQRAAIRRAEIDSVALTAANNATGLFELTPIGQQSEFLNPFEGMGIESRWEFKMPKFSNRMDYNNIADILLTVEYTALDSFQYRAEVLQELQNETSFNRGFSYKNNFPDQWYELAQVEPGTGNFSVTVDLKREFFPQGIDELQLDGNVVLYFVRSSQYDNEINVAKFGIESGSSIIEGELTNGGKLVVNINNGTENSPVMKLKLEFENNLENRELFSTEQVTDILLLIPCKGTLMQYPL